MHNTLFTLRLSKTQQYVVLKAQKNSGRNGRNFIISEKIYNLFTFENVTELFSERGL